MKATKAVVTERVTEVLKLRLKRAEFHDVWEYSQQLDPENGRPWPVSKTTVWRYWQKANEQLDQSLEKDRRRLLNLHLGMRGDMYAHAMEQGDIKTALAVARDEAELLGLYPETEEGKRHVNVNLFARIEQQDEKLRIVHLDADLPASGLESDRRGEPLDSPPADPEASRVLASG